MAMTPFANVHLMLFFLVVVIVVSASSESQCTTGMTEQTYVSLTTNVKKNYALEGFALDTLSVYDWHKCFSKCVKNCQCLSYNFNDVKTTQNCELNDANTCLAPGVLKVKEGVSYHEPVRKYYKQKGACSNPACKKCCDSSPCQNGGTCCEVCDVNKRRFNCTCPPGFNGYKCQVPQARSCKDIMMTKDIKANGKFNIVDDENVSFPVYCDFSSEPGAAWTLIQFHFFSNNDIFKTKPFLVDMPVNQDVPEWASYRLSMSRMKSIWNSSTHWRATCNYSTNGIDYRDYVRASFESLDLFVVPSVELQCRLYDFLNIRGNQRVNCTALTAYSEVYPQHIDSWFSSANRHRCEFNGRPNEGLKNEDNFGYYDFYNSAFRCSSSPSATTQFWLGRF